MNNKFQYGVFFDLDGVLVNSESLKSQAHVRAIQTFGGTIDSNFYKSVMGHSQDYVAQIAITLSGIGISIEKYNARFKQQYKELLDNGLKCNDGILPLIKHFHTQGFACALVTSSDATEVSRILKIVDLDKSFDTIVTADEVHEHKPSPEAYLAAMKTLGVVGGKGVAFEDSSSGIVAAKRAGLLVLAIRHAFNISQDLSYAEIEVQDLRDTKKIIKIIYSLLRVIS